MSNTKTGGPAFPSAHPHGQEEGMSLRDYLAINADIGNVDEITKHTGESLLKRECPNYQSDFTGCIVWWADVRATLRYIEADSMLKAREA